jgi:hypothetical protein
MRSWTLGALVFPLLLVLPSGAARGADPPDAGRSLPKSGTPF